MFSYPVKQAYDKEAPEPSVDVLREYAKALSDFLSVHSNLFDFSTHTNRHDGKPEKAAHFIQSHHWESRVPDDWRSWFDSIDASDDNALVAAVTAVQCADTEKVISLKAPPSLVEFLETIRSLAQPWDCLGVSDDIHTADSRTAAALYNEGPCGAAVSAADAAIALMPQKKKYETRVLGRDILDLVPRSKTETIVDIGAGKGYLTQWVAAQAKAEGKDLRVVAVEGSETVLAGYRTRQTALTAIAEKRQRKETRGEGGVVEAIANVKAVSAVVKAGDGGDAFFSRISAEHERVMLVGLHTCGDLGSAVLRLFATDDRCGAVDVVGCCYHHLTEGVSTSDDDVKGFPLSEWVLEKIPSKKLFILDSGRHLGANALPQTLTSGDVIRSARMQSYRTALEAFIAHCVYGDTESGREEDPQPHHIGNMRGRYSEGPFGVYCVRAIGQMLRKLDEYDQVTQEYKEMLREAFKDQNFSNETLENPLAQRAERFYESLGPAGKAHILPRVAYFSSLRNAVGPVIEAFVICDRLLFVAEECKKNGSELEILHATRLFRPEVSPRSFVIRAIKKQKE